MNRKPSLPQALARAYLDKQVLAKVASAPRNTLGDDLALLTRLHLGINWDDFDDAGLGADQAQARLAALDAAAGGKIKALAKQADEAGTVAGKLQLEAKKSGKWPKEATAALAAIVKAAQDYRTDIDECVAGARTALTARAGAKPAAQKGPSPAVAVRSQAESKGAKLVRSRALDAIRSLRKPVKGAKPLQFLVVLGKTTATTYLGVAAGPTQEKILRGLIPNDGPYRVIKDPQGQLLWEKNAVTIVSDKLPGGLAKKMQAWLKTILKLNLRLRVRRTSGEVEETDGEDLPVDLPVTDVEDLDDIEAALDDLGDADEEGETTAASADAAIADWRAGCTEVRNRIRRLEGEIVKFKDPNSTAAVIQLESVVKNLVGVPASQQQVVEFETWLRDDDVVGRVEQPNPWDLPVDVRSTLLPLLSALKAHLPA